MSKSAKKTVSGVQTADAGQRRNFLIGVGLGGAATAAALLGGKVVNPVTEAVPEPQAESKGYSETEHVRRYYGTARI
ncbi:MAG TPA: hypothetical protein VL550_07455 [Rhodocyclaceae bacterium]|jgi:hypothetical protein|nr:hypothetical protein [Rhodocyclaceae bacterium]